LPQISLRLAFPHNSMLYMTHPWRTKLQEISTSAALKFFDWCRSLYERCGSAVVGVRQVA
jgi:hypothetical protein